MAAVINNKEDLDNHLLDLYYKFNDDKKNGEREFKAAVKSIMRELIGIPWAKRSGAVKYLDSLYKRSNSLDHYFKDHIITIQGNATKETQIAEQKRVSAAAAADRRVSRARDSDARRRNPSRSRPRSRSRSRQGNTSRAAGTMADDTAAAAQAARTLFGQKKKSKKSKKIKRRKSKKYSRRRIRKR